MKDFQNRINQYYLIVKGHSLAKIQIKWYIKNNRQVSKIVEQCAVVNLK